MHFQNGLKIKQKQAFKKLLLDTVMKKQQRGQINHYVKIVYYLMGQVD